MNMRDPGEKGENFKAVIFVAILVIFAIKSYLSMQNVPGSSMVLFSSFYVAYFGQKTSLKILYMDIFEAFGQYENHFRTD